MGIDARVYLAKRSLPDHVERLGARRDPITGEYYFEGTMAANQFPPGFSVAIHKRIGNAQTVAELRQEVRDALGTTHSLLYERCLKSGTHSGDVIEYGLLDQLEQEVIKARKWDAEKPLLKDFLDAMAELIQVGKREINPIVFV
jgi:hypothetical protein